MLNVKLMLVWYSNKTFQVKDISIQRTNVIVPSRPLDGESTVIVCILVSTQLLGCSQEGPIARMAESQEDLKEHTHTHTEPCMICGHHKCREILSSFTGECLNVQCQVSSSCRGEVAPSSVCCTSSVINTLVHRPTPCYICALMKG